MTVSMGSESGRSCVSELLTHYDRIMSIRETGANVDAIY